MIEPYEIILRLVIGAIIGAVIGYERQQHGRPAGIRTHLLVCTASVIIMIISTEYYHLSSIDPSYVRVDPARIAAGAITGVGFLGAGVIIKSGPSVLGLTTAACLWMISAIGLAIGGGLYTLSISGFILTYFSLFLVRKFEKNSPALHYKILSISTKIREQNQQLLDSIKETGCVITNIDYELNKEQNRLSYNITISFKQDNIQEKIIKVLNEDPTVMSMAFHR
ncbi:MAG: MgtC/SapB family protein [Nitrospirae bacterium]|nr:MgtC/SapB family protein [Nitrospirota bacterium]